MAGKTQKKRHEKFKEKAFGKTEDKKKKKNTHQVNQEKDKLEAILEGFNFDDDEKETVEEDNEMKIVKPGQGTQGLKIKKNEKKMLTKRQKKNKLAAKQKAEKYTEILSQKVIKNLKKDIQKIK